MTPQQAREQIGFALKRAAPGSDVDVIDPDADLRDALELDSLDFLQFIEILSETSGHRIEEDDYPELATLNSSIRFLAARLPPGGLTWLPRGGSASAAAAGTRPLEPVPAGRRSWPRPCGRAHGQAQGTGVGSRTGADAA